MTPPPGYADPDAPPHQPLVAPVFALAATLLVIALSFYEIGVAAPIAFGKGSPAAHLGMNFLSALVGAWLGRQLSASPPRTAAVLALLAIFASASGYLQTLEFVHDAVGPGFAWGIPLSFAASSGLAASLLLRALGPALARTNGFSTLLNPWRASLLAIAVLLVLLAFPQLGVVRRAAFLGALLAGGALLTLFFGQRLALTSERLGARAWLVGAAPLAALAALGGAERIAPLTDVRRHTGELLYAFDGARAHHAFVKIQGGLVLFSDHLLALTTTDAPRFAEALVHPVMAAASKRDAVLVLDDGAGAVLQQVRRWDSRVTFVPSDPELSRLAARLVWLRDLGAFVSALPFVSVDQREPAVFLLRDPRRFDVILQNLGDPTSYLNGKYYTVALFEAVRARLAPGGLFALQITSPERTPSTHASIVATLQAAGFTVRTYRAPLPTLGEWGFAIAAPTQDPAAVAALARVHESQRFPIGTTLVTAQTLPGLFAEPALRRPATATPSFLYDQPVVELYQSEERAFTGE